jgi:hypothetical protein
VKEKIMEGGEVKRRRRRRSCGNSSALKKYFSFTRVHFLKSTFESEGRYHHKYSLEAFIVLFTICLYFSHTHSEKMYA